MEVKQVQTISHQGALLITNRKFSMFVTIIGTTLLATYQLVIMIMDNFLTGMIPCKTIVYITVCLHPVATFCGSYILLFLRQYFTLQTLRQTPLKVFIPTLGSPIAGLVAFIFTVGAPSLVCYLILVDRPNSMAENESNWIKFTNTDSEKVWVSFTMNSGQWILLPVNQNFD